ncbi:proton-coupled folate transporter-like [Actinia tenebrosa]|uniref:Proton-coupled folate transporter-like n=1 Tax=Actinia tenebrosa TaxID=6105 RepID=A0A6P8H5S1_ACTTE|nr:proton-coupled folate transporter-like [Actinia tenebrosa]
MAPKRFNWRQLLTAEPVVFFYAYGLFMHLPVIQQYIYFRIAKNKGFPYDTTASNSCGNETALNATMKGLEKQVQSLSSYIHLGVVLFSSLPSLFTSLFIGSWTDSRGRKPALLLPAIGSSIEAGLTILVMYLELPVYVLFVGGAINGLCGYFTTLIMGLMAYIADTTDESDRPLRLAIMELLTFLGGMVSQLTSGVWIENHGFITPYWFILACLLFSVLYTVFFLPESRPPSDVTEKTSLGSCQSIKRILAVYKAPREGGRFNLILLTLSSAFSQIATQGSTGIVTLFVLHTPLCFSPEFVGYIAALRSLCIGIGAILGIKLLGIWLTELSISRIGIVSSIGGLVTFGLSKTTFLVFTAPVVGLFGGCVVPIFRAMMSRIVSKDEQGALFSAVASFETLCNFIGAFIFNSLYPASLKFDFPGFVFFVGAIICLLPFCFTCCLKNPMVLLSKKDRVQVVGNYDVIPDDNLNDPVKSLDSCNTEGTTIVSPESKGSVSRYNTEPQA